MRYLFYQVIALIFLIFLSPLFAVLFVLVKLSSTGPFIFQQNRVGERGKIFTIYKIRTMVNNADKLKSKYQHLNEAHHPVFKIRNDPRFTAVGKLISRFALDELPQLINIIKGDMSFVGPRPLPIAETASIPLKYKPRFDVRPGLTSPWVIAGQHKLPFTKWMNLDTQYILDQNIWHDLKIIYTTVRSILKI